MYSWTLIFNLGFTLFILSLHVPYVWMITTTKSMTAMDRANLPVYVNDSLILELTEEILTDYPDKFLQTTVEVVTEPNKRLLIHFLSLDISFDNNTPDRLHIYDYLKTGEVKRMTPVMGLFGVYDSYYQNTSPGVGDYKSSKNKLRLNYMGRPTMAYSGFRILFTAFKDPKDSGDCPHKYRKCSRTHICIPLTIMCDSEYNCGQGDVSDEDTCHLVISNNDKANEAIVTAVVTAVIAISVFIIIVIVVFCIMKRYNNRNFVRRQSLQVVAKRKADGEWLITDNMTALYAPPTYEDVVATKSEEPPPTYCEAITNSPMGSPCQTPRSRRSMTSPEDSVTVVHIENMVRHELGGCGDIEIENEAMRENESNAALAGSNSSINSSNNEQVVSSAPEESKSNTASFQLSNTLTAENSSSDELLAKSSSSSSVSSHIEIGNVSNISSGIGHEEEDDLYENSKFLDKDTCKSEPVTKASATDVDLSRRMCIIDCDEIEYMDDLSSNSNCVR